MGKGDVTPPQNTRFVRVDIVATFGRSQRLRSPSPLGGVGEGLLLNVGLGGVFRWRVLQRVGLSPPYGMRNLSRIAALSI